MQAGVCPQHQPRTTRLDQPVQERIAGRRLPQKLVRPPRAAMAQVHPHTVPLDVRRHGQLLQPTPILPVRVRQRVVITDLSKQVVSRIGVPALAVGQLVPDAVVVVALDAKHLRLAQHRHHPVRIGSKRTHVSQAIQLLHITTPRIRNRSLQGQVVAVQAPEKRQPHLTPSPAPSPTGPSIRPTICSNA